MSISFNSESSLESLILTASSAYTLLELLGIEPRDHGSIEPSELVLRLCRASDDVQKWLPEDGIEYETDGNRCHRSWVTSRDLNSYIFPLAQICYEAEMAAENVEWG